MRRGAAALRIVLLIAVLLTIGCGTDDPSLSLLQDSDIFQQNVGARSTKVDILWVVDNSGSMKTSQENLAANFSSFIKDFQKLNYDFQIGVITTDAYRELYTSNSNFSKLKDGLGDNHSGEFVITPQTENIEDVFLTNIIQGVNGSGDERAFQSIETALLNPFNSMFLRPEAFLAVVIVSDEDDFSRDSAAWKEDYKDPLLFSIQHYKDFLNQVKPPIGSSPRFSISAMGVWDEACRKSLSFARIGKRYGELVEATGGTKSSLCGNFADELEFLANDILELASQFYLSRIPIVDSIRILVNGVEMPKSGWTYLPESNSITFSKDFIPAEGEKIDVKYDPKDFNPK
ncbi:MAG: VWA domain-containing protein [Bdellovibrionales bacterium]|nr:VWA domain-containing protein [Bdellovibrionales bacterium]